jgi:outer membrane lipoprotein LolB
MSEGVQRVLRSLMVLVAAFLIAACATPTKGKSQKDSSSFWEGRIAVKVYSTPVQAFSADFELEGNSDTGNLGLHTALGSTVAQLQWAPGLAQLTTRGAPQVFESLPVLVREATGAEIPIAALFDWLQGTPTQVEGWDVDLQDLPNGRLVARRSGGDQPAVDLKIILLR